MATRTHLNRVAITRVVGQGYSKAAAKRAATRTAARARQNTIASGLIDTGRLADSWKIADVTTNPLRPTFTVGSRLKRARYPEFGTDDYQAPPGKVMRFKPKGSNVYIFRKKRRGMRAYGMLTRAKRALRPKDFTVGG